MAKKSGGGKRSATPSEAGRNLRKERASKGTTKAGTRSSKAEKAEARRMEAQAREAEALMAAENAREQPLRGDTSGESNLERSDISGRASGLSEDVGQELGGGVRFGSGDDAPAPPDSPIQERIAAEQQYWEDFGVTPSGKSELEKALGTIRGMQEAPPKGRVVSAQEAAVDAARASSRAETARRSVLPSVELDRAGVPTRTLPPDVPLTKADVVSRQQFFLGESGFKKVAPGETEIPIIGRNGKPTTMRIIRPNRALIDPLQKTLVNPAKKEAREAASLLTRAEAVNKLSKVAEGKQVADSGATPVTSAETDEAGRTTVTTATQRGMTLKEAAQVPSSEGGLSAAERKALYGRAVGQAASPKLTGVVGDTTISDQFRENVEELKRKAEEAAGHQVTSESPFKIAGGGAAKDFVSPEDLTAFTERAAGAKNPLRYATREPRWRKKMEDTRHKAIGLGGPSPVTDMTDAEADKLISGLTGNTPVDRLRNMYDQLPPAAQEEIMGKLKRGRVPEGAQAAMRKEALTPEAAFGTQLRTSDMPVGPVSPRQAQNVAEGGQFLKVAKGRRLIAYDAGRNIGSQTADEAADVTAGEDWLKRQIQSNLMGGNDPTSTSQAAMHIRAADAGRLGRRLDQTRLSRSGMADPTDEQIVVGQKQATHRAATEALAAHHNQVLSHLMRARESATGYAQAAFSTVTRGNRAGLDELAGRIGDLGSRGQIVRQAAAAGLEGYRRGAYWDRGPGGAGEAKTRVDMPAVEASFETPRAPKITEANRPAVPSEPIVRPADVDADVQRQQYRYMSSTPEGRAQQAAGSAKAAEDKQYLTSLEEKEAVGRRPKERDTGLRYGPAGGTRAQGYEMVARDSIKAMQATSKKNQEAKLGGPVMPHYGNKMKQVGLDAQYHDSRGIPTLFQLDRFAHESSIAANFVKTPTGRLAQHVRFLETQPTGYGLVAKRGIYEAEESKYNKFKDLGSRFAPKGSGFFQRVASKGQFGE